MKTYKCEINCKYYTFSKYSKSFVKSNKVTKSPKITCTSVNSDKQEKSSVTNSNNSTFGLIKKGLRIGNLNICHLLPKLDEIKLLMIFKQSTFLEYARHF